MSNMRHLLRRGALLLAAFVITAGGGEAQAPAKPTPDVLVFTNGDQLTGKFVRGEGSSIIFKSDMAGEVTIPLAKVKELRAGGNFAVLTNDALKKPTQVPIGQIQVEQDAVRVVPASTVEQTIPDKQLAFIVDQTTYNKELTAHPGLLSGWNGSVTAGATLVRSTQTGETFTLAAGLVRAIPTVAYLPKRNRTIFDIAETYGKLTQPAIPQAGIVASQTVTSIFHADAERDEYFSPRFYALADTSFDHNYSLGLNLQEVYGGGIGWTAIQTPRQELDVRTDIHYEKQQFQTPSNNTNLIGSTISENYTRNLPKKIVFTESASILPAFNNASDYSANLMAGIMLPVYHRLSANFNATDNFLNNPAPGFNKNSFQFVTGISYSLP